MRTILSSKLTKKEFIEKVEEISGQNVFACYHCGKCSAGCPIVSEMDLLPNQVIRYVQLGLQDEVLNSKSIWMCASCYTCTVRCPKDVDLAKIMEALRVLKLRQNIDMSRVRDLPSEDLESLPPIALVSAFRKYTP